MHVWSIVLLVLVIISNTLQKFHYQFLHQNSKISRIFKHVNVFCVHTMVIFRVHERLFFCHLVFHILHNSFNLLPDIMVSDDVSSIHGLIQLQVNDSL